jgi:hypothetical protein
VLAKRASWQRRLLEAQPRPERVAQGIADTRGAIVEEEVVLVGAVLGARIPFQKGKQPLLLRRREAQLLLDDGPPEPLILSQKGPEGRCDEEVGELPVDEFRNEVWLAEVVRAVVVGAVQSPRRVAHAQGAVAESGGGAAAGQDREERDVRPA